MMVNNKTDKSLLVKGIKNLVISISFMFLGPTLTFISSKITIAYKKYVAIILGIIICILAVYYAFRGISIIMKSLFNK